MFSAGADAGTAVLVQTLCYCSAHYATFSARRFVIGVRPTLVGFEKSALTKCVPPYKETTNTNPAPFDRIFFWGWAAGDTHDREHTTTPPPLSLQGADRQHLERPRSVSLAFGHAKSFTPCTPCASRLSRRYCVTSSARLVTHFFRQDYYQGVAKLYS